MGIAESLGRLSPKSMSWEECTIAATGDKLEPCELAAAMAGLPRLQFEVGIAYFCGDRGAESRLMPLLFERFEEIDQDLVLLAWNIFIFPPGDFDKFMARIPKGRSGDVREVMQYLVACNDMILGHVCKHLGH